LTPPISYDEGVRRLEVVRAHTKKLKNPREKRIHELRYFDFKKKGVKKKS